MHLNFSALLKCFIQWSVRDHGSYGWVLEDCPFQCNWLSW